MLKDDVYDVPSSDNGNFVRERRKTFQRQEARLRTTNPPEPCKVLLRGSFATMSQVKSKQRVADHGEVFTPTRTYPPVTVCELAGIGIGKTSEVSA